jgi:hypothetical protein
MIQENELILLMLGIGVLFFIVGNHSQVKKFPEYKVLIAGFFAFLTGWLLTVLEGFFWEKLLNFMEHICYIGGSVLVAIWCWKIFGRKGS